MAHSIDLSGRVAFTTGASGGQGHCIDDAVIAADDGFSV